MTPSRVMNSSTITFLMTEFLQHLATFGADHVCSSVFPFFSLPLAFGMTDGERRFSCNVHVYLFYEPRKKTAIRILLQSSPGFRVGKISQCACAFLDESLAWVLRKSLFYECTTSACNSPLAFAILWRSARSIPMVRTDFLPFTSKIVEHSRYLPGEESVQRPRIEKRLLLDMLWSNRLMCLFLLHKEERMIAMRFSSCYAEE
jgi:hypothetical protein